MQENVEDFTTLPPPNKSDPKYQTLPYNAKLFAPFGSKHEQENFEKSMQQMQLISADHHQSPQTNSNNNNCYYHQTTTNNANPSYAPNGGSANSPQQQEQQNPNYLSSKIASKNSEPLHPLVTHNHQNASSHTSTNGKSSGTGDGGLNSNIGVNNSNNSYQMCHYQSSSTPLAITTSTAVTTGCAPNGLQTVTVHSTQANHNVSKGNAMPVATLLTSSSSDINYQDNFSSFGQQLQNYHQQQQSGSTGRINSTNTGTGGASPLPYNAVQNSQVTKT